MLLEEKVGQLIIKKRNHILLLNISEILYIERSGIYSIINTLTDEIFLNVTLKDIEKYLPEYFIRAHRSFLINRKLLKELKPMSENTYEAIFSEEKTALVTKRLLHLIC